MTEFLDRVQTRQVEFEDIQHSVTSYISSVDEFPVKNTQKNIKRVVMRVLVT